MGECAGLKLDLRLTSLEIFMKPKVSGGSGESPWSEKRIRPKRDPRGTSTHKGQTED